MRTEVGHRDRSRQESARRRTDHDGVGLGEGLKARRHVRRLAERQRLVPALSADLADHDRPRVDTDPDRERDASLALESRVQHGDRVDDAEASAHRAARGILSGGRAAEVHEQTVPEVLRDMAMERPDHGVTDLLVGAHHLSEHLGIEAAGQLGRPHEVAEHHGELPALSIRRPLRVGGESADVGGGSADVGGGDGRRAGKR